MKLNELKLQCYESKFTVLRVFLEVDYLLNV